MGDTIWLQRPTGDVPWGFRISGGRDFQEPIRVSRVSGGSIASSRLVNGDVLLQIGNSDASCLTHSQANDIIKNSGNTLQLCVVKGNTQDSVQNTQGPSQVVRPYNTGSAVHDLFEDMYSDPRSHSLLDFQGGASDINFNPHQPQTPINSYNPHKINVSKSASSHKRNNQTSPSEIYDAFYDEYKSFNLQSSDNGSDLGQNGGVGNKTTYRNYKPDASLNTSIDSGVFLGHERQSSNVSMHSLSSTDPLASSNTSVNSDTPISPMQAQSSPVTNKYSDTSPSPLSPNANMFNGGAPPPPPPPISNFLQNKKFSPGQMPSKSWPKKDQENPKEDLKEFSTKLEQQLANMDLSYGGSNPTTPQSPYTPSMRGYQSPSASQPQPGYQHSPHSQNSPGYHPLANIPPPPASHPPMQNSYSPMSPSSYMPQQHSPGQKIPPKVPEKPAMPDAVLNMAAKGGTDKKPFAYAADMDEIKHHRDKVRRKPVGIPSYQNILNLPQFDDSPASTKIKPYHPPAPKYEPETPPIPAGPGEGVVAHAQYNTPLGLYSAENAEEAFKAQSGGLVTGVDGDFFKGLPGTKEKKDITESATYKMIHGISAPKPKPKITVPAHTVNHPPRGPAPDDEMTFSGVLRPTDIPSKSFHRLQSLTDHGEGGSEIDRTSIRPQHQLAPDDGGVGGYDEASIRYLGKNIPSRSFRMLQSMTGGADQPMPGPAAARRHPHRKREDIEPEEPEKHNDEIVDISYVGGNIPSRSFKMLQQQIGEPNDTTSRPPPGPHPNPIGRTVKVVKLRSAQPAHTDMNGATDF